MNALVLLSFIALAIPQTAAQLACVESGIENRLPEVVGPMVGASPAWMVDGGVAFRGAPEPVKTLWVVRRTSETLRISGRRLDGPGNVLMRQAQATPADVLLIGDPARASVIPGGAPAAVMREYAFLPSHVFYPSAGCWEFTIESASSTARIVRQVKTGEPRPPRPAVLLPPD